MLIWHYFYKAQMIIWHYFHKAQNNNLATISKSPNAILAHAYKTQILFLTLVLHILNPSLMGNIITHLSKNISFTKLVGIMLIVSHNQLTTKAQMLFWHMLTKLKYYS